MEGLVSRWSCNSLTNVTIRNGVISLAPYLFEDCASLATVVIGNNVTRMEEGVFDGCQSVRSV